MPTEPADAVPAWYRRFVGAYLAAVLACGILGLELHPLSGFRLFSAPRSRVATSIELVGIGALGGEIEVPLGSLPRAWRGLGLILKHPGANDLAPICSALTAMLGRRIPDLDRVEVVSRSQDLLPREGGRPASPPRRSPMLACEA